MGVGVAGGGIERSTGEGLSPGTSVPGPPVLRRVLGLFGGRDDGVLVAGNIGVEFALLVPPLSAFVADFLLGGAALEGVIRGSAACLFLVVLPRVAGPSSLFGEDVRVRRFIPVVALGMTLMSVMPVALWPWLAFEDMLPGAEDGL